MRFEDESVSEEHRCSIGSETGSGRCSVSIPVTARIVDYEECEARRAAPFGTALSDRTCDHFAGCGFRSGSPCAWSSVSASRQDWIRPVAW